MVNVLLAIGEIAYLPGWLLVGGLPNVRELFLQVGHCAVKEALLVVRVALLFTSAARVYFSVVSAFASELK